MHLLAGCLYSMGFVWSAKADLSQVVGIEVRGESYGVYKVEVHAED